MQKKILLITDSADSPSGMGYTAKCMFESLIANYNDRYTVVQLGLRRVIKVTECKWPIYSTKFNNLAKNATIDLQDLNGQQSLDKILAVEKPHYVYAFNDPQNLSWICNKKSFKSKNIKLITHINIDGISRSFDISYLKNSDHVVCGSRFTAKNYIAKNGTSNPSCSVIYPPINVSLFKRLNADEKQELRSEIITNKHKNVFLMGFVGLNVWRKQMWVLYAILSILKFGKYRKCINCGYFNLPSFSNICTTCHSTNFKQCKKSDDIKLWIHSPRQSKFSTWNLQWLEQKYNLKTNKDIFYTECLTDAARLPPSQMQYIYQILDVLVYPSGGEGFGNPVFEAFQCGIPCISTNYSSHAELVRESNGGITINGILQPESDLCILRCVPNMEELLNAIIKLKNNPELRTSLGQNAHTFCQQYTPEKCANDLNNVFSTC